MIGNIEYSFEEGILLSYEKNGAEKQITYEMLSAIWDGLEEDFYEGGKAYLWGDQIAFSVVTADGQDAVFFVWDTETEEFVHYSDCAYFSDAVKVKDDIIILSEVSTYTTPYHLEAHIIPFGVKDINDSGQRLYCEQPVVYHSSEPMGVELQITENCLEVIDDAEVLLYSSDVNEIRNQQPNPEFAHLYKPSASKSKEEKLAIRSMLT